MSRPKKRLGQHFLSDPRILGRIADALELGPKDVVLEIGPGPGGLTAALLARTPHVVAIEKDRDLVPGLRERFPGLLVVEGDALDLDWHGLERTGAEACPTNASGHLDARPGDASGCPDAIVGQASAPVRSDLPPGEASAPARLVKIAGNIPYNITSPLIDKALTPPMPERVVFLVQKEVAERVAAAPGGKEYGALTVGVQAVARVERLFTVPAGAFKPPPKVDSAVLRLTPRPDPLVPIERRASFRRLVVGLFGFRRKQLLRGLRELTGWPADRVAAILVHTGLAGQARPEMLSPGDFARLHGALVDGGWVAD